MFFFGHLGIGSKLASPLTSKKGLPKAAVLIGTVLPDLIDKPLYYVLSYATGKHGTELGLICGSRTFGHTAILTIFVSIAALIRKSRWIAGLALGMATHLLLDNLRIGEHGLPEASINSLHALLWPALGYQFPAYVYKGLTNHLEQVQIPVVFWTEILGLMLLAWDFWKSKHGREILNGFQNQRKKSRKIRSRLHKP